MDAFRVTSLFEEEVKYFFDAMNDKHAAHNNTNKEYYSYSEHC